MSAEPLFKRRRLNETAQILSKPFVSPLKTAKAARKPLQQNDNAHNIPYQPSVLAHTTKASAVHFLARDTSENVIQTPTKSNPVRRHLHSRSAPGQLNADELNAQKALTALELQIRNIRNEIDTLREAARLSSSSTDFNLKAITHKWKQASQAAAEDVFETVKKRVDHMGGVSAWRQSERHKYERNAGWDATEKETKDDADCEFDSDGEELPEEEKECRRERKREARRSMEEAGHANSNDEAEHELRQEDDDESHLFTMEMMLQSLNIELDVIGYDKAAQTWSM